jgi:hypothetical protein
MHLTVIPEKFLFCRIVHIPKLMSTALKGSTLGGINDLLRRLEEIEVHCLGQAEGKLITLDEKDKFLTLKASMNRDLAEMKGKIYERRDIMKKEGTTHEVINLTSQIRVLELKLKEDLIQLKDIYRKQCDGSVFIFTGGSKPGPEELSQRYEAMDKIAYQMEEARKAFRTGQEMDGDYNADKLRNQLVPNSTGGGSGSDVPIGSAILTKQFREGELDDEEKDAMNRWTEREQKLDRELQDVSIAVDRLKPLAQEIHATGQKQERMIDMINNRADKAAANLRGINLRLRKFIDTNRRSTFIFRIVLILILLGLGAYVYVKARGVDRKG